MARLLDGSEASIHAATEQLVRGGLVGLPTETVYGLAADANNPVAVRGIFDAKGRPHDHPLIAHIAPPTLRTAAAWRAALEPLVTQVPASALQLAQLFWPGPLTLVFQRREGVCEATAGGLSTLAVRCPAHPVAQALLLAAQSQGVLAVAAPSANRFGRVSPTTAAHVMDEFDASLSDAELVVIDGGACEVGIESSIVDCSSERPALLRPGLLSADALAQAMGHSLAGPSARTPKVSGSLESHYAPQARVQLLSAAQLAQQWAALSADQRAATAVYARHASTLPAVRVAHNMGTDAQACAHELFAVLRALDQAEVSHIWVERPPVGPEWAGVSDRLQRAAA